MVRLAVLCPSGKRAEWATSRRLNSLVIVLLPRCQTFRFMTPGEICYGYSYASFAPFLEQFILAPELILLLAFFVVTCCIIKLTPLTCLLLYCRISSIAVPPHIHTLFFVYPLLVLSTFIHGEQIENHDVVSSYLFSRLSWLRLFLSPFAHTWAPDRAKVRSRGDRVMSASKLGIASIYSEALQGFTPFFSGFAVVAHTPSRPEHS